MIVFTGLFSAFLTGLIGSIHCIGMCGGIVGAVTMRLSPDIRQSPLRLIPYLFTYNIGRIISYTFAGLLIGLLGTSFSSFLPEPQKVSRYISGGFMIALGLYLGMFWPALAWFEKLGAYLWRWIKPLDKRLFPINTLSRMFGLGLVWGWLPCGLVYTALALALSVSLNQNGPIQAALLMLAFGLGTIPVLMAIGSTAYWFTHFIRNRWVQKIAGILVILFGLSIIFMPHTTHSHAVEQLTQPQGDHSMHHHEMP